VADVDTTLLEVPAEALRATMAVPEVQRVMLTTMTSRLQRTESADFPRLAGIDQADLRDLRTPRPQVEALPRTYDGHEAGGAVG
jgi:CRP-like cAMP-binding protein